MQAVNTLVLATNNANKVDKLSWIFKPYFSEISKQSNKIDVNENGKTFKENAEIKAKEVSTIYSSYAVATDGGVLIPSLGNNWNGLFTKRFIGIDNASDFDRMDALLELMKDKTGEDRSIVWKEAIAIAYCGKLIFSIEVEGDKGMIQYSYDKNKYKEGIWQCSLTCYPNFNNKNFFDLNEEERKYSEISWHKLKAAVDRYAKKNGGVIIATK